MPLSNFTHLNELFDRVIETIPLHFFVDHISKVDKALYFKYFKGYRPQKLGRKRIADSLRKELYEKNNEMVADLLQILWNQANNKIYHAMLALVKTVNEDVESIERIADDKAKEFIEALKKDFTPEDIYICVRLNEVKFDEAIISSSILPSDIKELSKQESEKNGQAEQNA